MNQMRKNEIGTMLVKAEIKFAARSYLTEGYNKDDAIAAAAEDVKINYDIPEEKITAATKNLKMSEIDGLDILPITG